MVSMSLFLLCNKYTLSPPFIVTVQNALLIPSGSESKDGSGSATLIITAYKEGTEESGFHFKED
jgi:hypothetical protein